MKMKLLQLLLVQLAFIVVRVRSDIENEHPTLTHSRSYVADTEELNSDYWKMKAQATLAEKLKTFSKKNTNRAKNIILFLGDGMSVHTITATRAFLGDISKQVYFEKFPYVGLSKTYAVDKRVPDSASTATAYLNGVKANYGTVGVNAQVTRNHCTKANDTSTHTESLAKWAQDAGKWAGLVTTARVTHASPAGVYAHVANREWEQDAAIREAGCDPEVNVDIARQLVEWPVGRELRVVLGCGRRSFIDETVLDIDGEPGRRQDKRDLISEWVASKGNANAKYVSSKGGLKSVDLGNTDYLLGLFNHSHCRYHGDIERENLQDAHPTLSEMTETAIKMLRRNSNGYFLFVEGARIDMAHHDTRAQRSLEDTAEFARAVELARSMTSTEDTLIVVTSDHSHTMTINGYADRHQNIFGLAPDNAADNLPYTILSYANGPGYDKAFSSKVGRKDLNDADLTDPKHKYPATVPLESETHGSDDVAIFASGPLEHYFTGNFEQTNIPALIAHAANIGPFTKEALDI